MSIKLVLLVEYLKLFKGRVSGFLTAVESSSHSQAFSINAVELAESTAALFEKDHVETHESDDKRIHIQSLFLGQLFHLLVTLLVYVLKCYAGLGQFFDVSVESFVSFLTSWCL